MIVTAHGLNYYVTVAPASRKVPPGLNSTKSCSLSAHALTEHRMTSNRCSLRTHTHCSLTLTVLLYTFPLAFIFGLLVVSQLAIPAVAAEAAVDDLEDEDDEFELPPPGLIATYTLAGKAEPRVTRLEPTAAILLAAGESPDPRLEPRNWSAHWSGQLQVLQPGKYRFSAQLAGALKVQVGEHLVLAADTTNSKEVTGDELELPFGTYDISIDYTPADKDARLRLMWESDQFAKEPLPAASLSHKKDQWADSNPDGWLSPFAHGQLLAEEYSCLACHAASEAVPLTQSMSYRSGPHLEHHSARLKPGWIYAWLADPQAFRHEVVMPQLFANNPAGDAQRYALATYLGAASSADEKYPVANSAEQASAGKKLFERVGCAVCHEKQGDRPARATLANLSQKTTPEQLARFLQDPLAIDPSGRMPHMFLTEEESQDLAQYLLVRDAEKTDALELPTQPTAEALHTAFASTDPSSAALKAFDDLSLDAKINTLAEVTLKDQQCINCHEVRGASGKPPEKPHMAKSNMAAVAQAVESDSASLGCLANNITPGQGTPRFSDELRHSSDLRTFLAMLPETTGTSSPAQEGLLTLERFQCVRCHDYNGQGGLTPEYAAKQLAEQTEAAAELIHPPTLTGVVKKLLAPQLSGTLVEGSRARPWMDLRMPGFPKQSMSTMPQRLAALEGDPLVEKNPAEDADESLVEAGLTLISSQGFGCTKCHDLAGQAGTGTRGPDLANVPSRVNYDWYCRWMTDPQRMQPGTRMPTVFFQGQSPYQNILGGDPQRQRDAMWAFLSVAAERPKLVESMPDASAPQELATASMPRVMRTFLPNLSPRSMAIRYPSGIHLTYDAQSCRLGYAWQGEFLDLNPVWTERGGREAGIKGDIFWRSPAGFPWEVTAGDAAPPEFAGRGEDIALGAMLPDDKKFYPTRLDFHGYHLTPNGPIFEYELFDKVAAHPGTSPAEDRHRLAHFTENVRTFASSTLKGVTRQTTIDATEGSLVWLNVADCETPPQLHASDGRTQTLQPEQPVPASGTICELTQAGAPLLVSASSTPSDAQWVLVKAEAGFRLLLKLPAGKQGVEVTVNTAVPSDQTPAAITKAITEFREQPASTITIKHSPNTESSN